MKNINKKMIKLKEDGAGGSTGGGSVACVPGGLFSGTPIKRSKQKTIPVIKYKHPVTAQGHKVSESTDKKPSLLQTLLREFASADDQGADEKTPSKPLTFDPTSVVSKLTAAEKKNDFNEKSVPFGLEDDEGNTVKVYVKSEQADDFESALSSMIEDTANSKMEIAELLFTLKNDFDIVHVEWGEIPEDEEQESLESTGGDIGEPDQDIGDQDLSAGIAGDQGSEPQDIPPTDNPDAEGELPPPTDDMSGGGGDVGSALSAVIDMLKADAEARKAEANAKAKQAEADQARFASEIANHKVRSEIEVLDMEAWNKRKDQEKKETKKLAQLARFRHEKAKRLTGPDMRAQYDKVGTSPEISDDDAIEV